MLDDEAQGPHIFHSELFLLNNNNNNEHGKKSVKPSIKIG